MDGKLGASEFRESLRVVEFGLTCGLENFRSDCFTPEGNASLFESVSMLDAGSKTLWGVPKGSDRSLVKCLCSPLPDRTGENSGEVHWVNVLVVRKGNEHGEGRNEYSVSLEPSLKPSAFKLQSRHAR